MKSENYAGRYLAAYKGFSVLCAILLRSGVLSYIVMVESSIWWFKILFICLSLPTIVASFLILHLSFLSLCLLTSYRLGVVLPNKSISSSVYLFDPDAGPLLFLTRNSIFKSHIKHHFEIMWSKIFFKVIFVQPFNDVIPPRIWYVFLFYFVTMLLLCLT